MTHRIRLFISISIMAIVVLPVLSRENTCVLEDCSIDRLVMSHERLALASTDAARSEALMALNLEAEAILETCNVFLLDIQALSEKFGAVRAGSEAEELMIWTWNAEQANRTQLYGGFVIWKGRDGSQIWKQLTHHTSRRDASILDDKKRFKAEYWPGAVYYELLITHQRRNPIYTLLGWDGADAMRTRKVVETISISKDRVRFGVPVIESDSGPVKRVILEYSDQVSAMLRWREDLKMIVLDHLSPPNDGLQGQTSFYGPDMTYDALEWQGTSWTMRRNVEIRDPDMREPWNDPKRRRRRQ